MNRRDAETQKVFDGSANSFFLRASASLRFIIVLTFLSTACSVPSLESPACTESKNAVRDFYSQHFGGDMKLSAENLKAREKFLTPEFARSVAAAKEGTDPFTTGTDDIPKTFRVGDCREISNEKTEASVLIFWRTDERTEQREIRVEAVDINDRWLVNNVSR